MPMTPTLIHLPQPMLDLLDRRAARDETSRSQVVRDAIAAHLRAESEEMLDERVRRAYAEHPLTTVDEWGDVASFLDEVRAQRDRTS